MTEQKLRLWAVIAVALLTVFYALSLYNTALFFTPVQTYFMTVTVLAGLVITVIMGGWRLRMPVWLILAFAYAGYTLLTTLWAANASFAVQGSVVTVGAVLVGVLGTVLPLWSKRYLIALLAAAGPAVYLFGLGTVYHLWNYVSATMPDQNGNMMMNSVFQYHNTFGAFEIMSFVLCIGLTDTAQSWWKRALYIMGAAISVHGVLLSYSREVWILLPVSAILMILAQWMRKRAGRTALSLCYSIVIAAASATFAVSALSHAELKMAILSLIVVTCGSLIVTAADQAFGRVFKKRSSRVSVLSIIGAVVVLAMVYVVHHEAHKLGSIATRVGSIQLKDFSVQQRLLFYQAALHMWTHNPIFGSGWGTWTAKFLAYQQYPYEATLVHSVVLDNLVNGGIIGFLLWIAMIVFAIISGIRSIRNGGEQAALSVAAVVAAVIMFLHGALDFDFSFGTIMVTFFLLVGMGAIPQPHEMSDSRSVPRIGATSRASTASTGPKWISVASPSLNIVMGAAACTSIVIGAMLATAQTLYNQATTNDKAIPTTEETVLQKAIQWAPYYADPHAQLAQVEFAQYAQTKTQQNAVTAWQQAQIAAQRDPWNPNTQKAVATIAFDLGQGSQAVEWAARAAKDSPYNVTFPSTYMGIALWTSVVQYQQDPTTAKLRFQSIADQLIFAENSVAAQKKMTFGYQPSWNYQVEAPMQAYAGAADYALGRYRASLSDITNLSQTGQDSATVGLDKMVKLLDDQRLHPGYSDAQIEQQINADKTLTAEYKDLSAIRPLK